MLDKSTAIICIFYNPSAETIEYWINFKELYPLIIIDNSSSSLNLSSENINYIPLYGNRGIAYAQNMGIKTANKLNFEHIIFFDQDSRPDPSIIAKLKIEFEALRNKNINIGAIGPKIMDSSTDKLYKGSYNNSCTPVIAHTLISSGTLTTINVLNQIGYMDERLFIDYVDNEWCWRGASKGYLFYISNDCVLNHKVGKHNISFLSYPFIISSPVRYFYQFRNYIWLTGNKNTPLKWKVKKSIRKIFELLIVPFYTDQPFKTLKYTLLGIKDGFKYFKKYNSMSFASDKSLQS